MNFACFHFAKNPTNRGSQKDGGFIRRNYCSFRRAKVAPGGFSATPQMHYRSAIAFDRNNRFSFSIVHFSSAKAKILTPSASPLTKFFLMFIVFVSFFKYRLYFAGAAGELPRVIDLLRLVTRQPDAAAVSVRNLSGDDDFPVGLSGKSINLVVVTRLG